MVIALVLINLAVLALFVFNPRPHMPPREGPRRIIIERLQLDPQQVGQYEALIHEHRQAVTEKESAIRQLKQQYFQQLKTPENPPNDSLLSAIGAAQQDIEKIHYRHFAEIRKICRPDQTPRFDALTDELVRFFSPPR